MNVRAIPLLAMITSLVAAACTPHPPAARPSSRPATQPAVTPNEPDTLQARHVRLVVNPLTGDATYFGAADGRRNLLGPGGVTTALVGVAPPELTGKLTKPAAGELLFRGVDRNQIAWTKRYRVVDDRTIAVDHTAENRGDRAFDAILYSLADLPDATIRGDNRDQHIRGPRGAAHFHAEIQNPHFPGEQMNPSALRSDSKALEPGDRLTFRMTWRSEVTEP